MNRASRTTDSKGRPAISFRCPGCEAKSGLREHRHIVCVEAVEGKPGPVWTWNESLELPTLAPSVNVVGGYVGICHSFIRGGRILYCPDSTHELSGKSVDLPEIDRANSG